MKNYLLLLYLPLLISLMGCKDKAPESTLSGLQPENFFTTLEGKPVELYCLKNKNGIEVCITNYGARVVSVMVPDRNGTFEDVVGGFSTIQEYTELSQNFGALVGRYIGRILNARFVLDDIEYKLVPNKDEHIAHGGDPGFAVKVWKVGQQAENALSLSYLSPDGENGFPGNLNVTVLYELTDDNGLKITYGATTDAPTVLNLSNHSFFNLSGDFNTTIEDYELYVNSSAITPYDNNKCVTGEIMSIKDTPFDFGSLTEIGRSIDEDNEQLAITGGYDHTWVLDTNGDISTLAAHLVDAKSGRYLDVYTTEPGIHVYTGNGLNGKVSGKNGIKYGRRAFVCLETMHFQDSPNNPHFPGTVLRPGEEFESTTIYKFGVLED